MFGRWLRGLDVRNVSVWTVVGWFRVRNVSVWTVDGWFSDEKRECLDSGWVV